MKNSFFTQFIFVGLLSVLLINCEDKKTPRTPPNQNSGGGSGASGGAGGSTGNSKGGNASSQNSSVKQSTAQNVLVANLDQSEAKTVLSILNSEEDATAQGWEILYAAGPSQMENDLFAQFTGKPGKRFPLELKKETDLNYQEFKSVGTDNIHFNVAKNNIPIGSNSLLDFTINVTDSQSINADLSDGENDDGAFQMILVLGNYSEDTDQTTVTHVLFLTYMSENFSKAKNYPRRVSLPQYLASTTAPPTDDIKQSNNEFVEAQSKKHGEAALESNRIKKVTGNVSATTNKDDFKFVEIYGQDGVWESYTLNLRNLIEHTYGEEESKKITHLFALGLESTAVSWNCADDNSASCKIQDISVIEMD